MIVSDCCRGNEAEHRRGDIVVQATSQLLCITQRSGPEELFGQRSPPPEHEDAAAPVPEHLTPYLYVRPVWRVRRVPVQVCLESDGRWPIT